MAKPLSSVTIVGGGTSGWLAATFLATALRSRVVSGELKITLIESAKIGIIGVGEALAPSMPGTLKRLGINETEFIKRCNVTFKLGGFFVDWNRDAQDRPTSWVNPFFSYENIESVNSGYFFSQFELQNLGGGERPHFTQMISPCPDAIAERKAPRKPGAKDFESTIRYAYHMDAKGFAELLKETATARGVHHVVDDVTDVNLDERGFVKSLTLEERGDHPVQFVIDATGFHSVILHRTMGEPVEPYENYLLNDRAAVLPLPHEDPTDIEPASRATAMKAGWRFRIPLFNRTGNGYIYSSKFLSDDEAIAELKESLGPRAADGDPKVIRMRIGKAKRSWVNNCVAIGLSSGFVEPLEATAIHAVEKALKWLLVYFPDDEFSPSLANRFNTLNDELYEEIVDYIVLHFRLSNRDDSEYWRAIRQEIAIPDRLAANFELWKQIMPYDADLPSAHFFGALNYTAALMGKGFYDGVALSRAAPLKREVWEGAQKVIRSQVRQALDQLPSHYDLLRHIRGEARIEDTAPVPNMPNFSGAQPIHRAPRPN